MSRVQRDLCRNGITVFISATEMLVAQEYFIDRITKILAQNFLLDKKFVTRCRSLVSRKRISARVEEHVAREVADAITKNMKSLK